jgi:hypothetical protein
LSGLRDEDKKGQNPTRATAAGDKAAGDKAAGDKAAGDKAAGDKAAEGQSRK